MNPETTNEEYTEFVNAGLSAGFTDEQVNFMWEYYQRHSDVFQKHFHKAKYVFVQE